MKLTEEQFYQMWCRYAREYKTKDNLCQALGLTGIRPLENRRDRMTAGYVFPLLSQSAPVPATDTHC
jgi:hypothetical protein